ncbi:FMNH2-dependent dimethyl sulfone monooxygenase [Barrientosiimonas humi]|uniref:FMNH2-dependent dimethyl sulfone monooxygenase n=2 Tax=Barrientosiimonas TaxID=1535207 RepID=A0A542XE56_9MICO|nr:MULTISPECIES: dimethyl sulfone monooxygenase SfnG [Barrientosiimonas]TQL34107.1 FMNH2-dependent dimethyl sulfone monooxygenase [Barrientosiimonas humi]BDZ59084.1 dimethyl sulfone monooxygenase SfnG [Barrientosiimonas endolithica]CAG7574097.1 Alkanesulfonate monooxygenase [Barrientosiimonas humi]
MSVDPLKFAYWVPNVSGGLVVSTLPQRTNHSPAYNIDTARVAEQNGFEYALTQVRYLASYGADAQHESTSFSQLLLANTEKLKVIAAVHPGFWQPAVLAKLAATAQEWSNDRFALNVVSGWFKQEFTNLGEPWLDHEERYRRSEEFIEVLKGAWSTDDFTFRGDFYRTRDLTFRPQPSTPPEVFQGGNSTSARKMAGRLSDWYFMNGNTVEDVRDQVEEVSGYGQEHDRRPGFGLNGFAVVRDTEDEARQVVQDIIDNADEDKVKAFGEAVKQAGKASSDGKGMWAGSDFKDLVQYNDGFKTGLVGTPEQVARRIVEYKKVGVDLLLVGFLHVQEEVERFGKEVIPLVRELEGEADAERGAA